MNKYVFLDRDGVINRDAGDAAACGYIKCWEEFIILPGVLDAIKSLTEAGYKIVIISNQQGVGKGYVSEEELKSVTDKMIQVIKVSGGSIAGVYYCTHLENENCKCRKPKEGLFHIAQKELNISGFDGNFFVGDTERDMRAGSQVGLKTILVLSGKSTVEEAENWEYKPDFVCKDLLEAARIIINDGLSSH